MGGNRTNLSAQRTHWRAACSTTERSAGASPVAVLLNQSICSLNRRDTRAIARSSRGGRKPQMRSNDSFSSRLKQLSVALAVSVSLPLALWLSGCVCRLASVGACGGCCSGCRAYATLGLLAPQPISSRRTT